MHILRRTSILWAATIALTPCAAAAADPSPPSPPPPPPPLSPEEGAKALRLPDGFRATLFAGEPDVVQPIAFTFDERGRLWVVECLSYPNWVPVGSKAAQDRVAIFTDKDNDGRFDEKKVFLADGRNLSGIEVGFGGVWLCSVPELLFVPDRDGNDAPDGPPEVVLDGWDLRAKHNVFNSLAWGPDGWLYGLNGILSSSLVGKPGAAAADRVPIDCGVWRYHVGRRRFEAVAHGTTNPWGIDWDDRGRMFITNCVIEHLWHVVPGAHFRRMYGEDLDPHVYTLLASGVDHIHWAGGAWQTSRGGQGAHGAAGGGHAHAGCMVYLGESWPRELRDSVFLCNIHGSRVNRDSVAPKGSTVVFRHERDFLQSADPWFRGLVLKQGPDDSAFLADWNDTGECHDYDEARVDTGRIFKISYGSGARPP
ncbi:MAG TPA: PVC-type heme-binding CxxCH protein, partial [Planctomycetota bacterium]|nr:PVC-type heme-binding CxxCH protein [Planctomycetota bacterium]